MNEKLDIDVKTLKPFTKFIYTIGVLPTSYLMSMTYEEQLIWLCNYLTQTIIPTINNNAEAVKEVQDLVTELQDYINNYFDNLNVQEEINNKLDEMAENGTLAEIIEDYATIPELTNRVTSLENNEKTEMIVIGDSFSSRTYLQSEYQLWCEIVAQRLNLTLHNYADPGAGFLNAGDERQSTFITQINEASSDASFNNNKVKYIFIMGGLNDLRYYSSNSIGAYTQAYNQLCITARNTFPTAKIIYLGCPSFETLIQKDMSDGQKVTQLWVDNYIKNCDQAKNKQISFLDMTLFYLGMSNYFTGGVGTHPNYIAHRDLSQAIINGLTCTGNAFKHIITATPTLNVQSQSTWTIGNTTTGNNVYRLVVTDKNINMYLSTSLTRNDNTLNMCILDLPFNIVIPYSQANINPLVPGHTIASYFEFATTHDNASCQGDGVLPLIYNLGYKYITIYNRWIKSTSLTIDITHTIEILI